MTRTACLTQIRKTFSYLLHILYDPDLLSSNSFKISHQAHVTNAWSPYWCLVSCPTHVPRPKCRSSATQKLEKTLTRRFYPVFSRKPSKIISSKLDNIIDITLSRTLIFSSLLLEEDVTGIQSCTSTTADNGFPYKHFFISANSFLPACCSAGHLPRRKITKACLLPTSHRLHALLKGVGRHEPDNLQKMNHLATRQFYQQVSEQSQQPDFEKFIRHRSQIIVPDRYVVFLDETYSSVEICVVFI